MTSRSTAADSAGGRIWVVGAAFVCVLGLGIVLSGCVGSQSASERRPTASPSTTLPAQDANSVDEFDVFVPEELGTAFEMEQTSLDSEEWLIGPHFGLKLSWLATGSVLPPNGALGTTGITPRRAPKGQELLVIAVDSQTRAGQWTLGDRPRPTAELVVGERATPLDKLPLEPTTGPASSRADGVIVIASVPVGAPVRLRVTDEERTQTLNVRTGKRAADAIAGYYRPYSQTMDWKRKIPVGASVFDGRDHVDTSLEVWFEDASSRFMDGPEPRATLAPYAPGKGWARPGRAWLVLPAPRVSDAGRKANVPAPTLTLRVRNTQAFHLELPNGTEAKGGGGQRKIQTALEPFDNVDDLIYDVPANFRKGTLVVDLSAASVLIGYSDAELPGVWSPTPERLTVPIRIG